jgi:LmbE family N-acetylglucosaminyl deacetylase
MSPSSTSRLMSNAKFFIRRALLKAMTAALRIKADRFPIESNTRCLVVAPHQDDAALGCGGLILGKRLEGNPVDIVYITDGSASHTGHPTLTPEALVNTRRAEELASIVILGVDRRRTHFLDAKDGTLKDLNPVDRDRIVERIADVLVRVRPDEIFLPCRSDGSSEHDASFILVKRAIAMAKMNPRLFEYPIWSLWFPQRLIGPLLASRRVWTARYKGYEYRKLRALSVYRSQMEPTPPWTKAVIPTNFRSFFDSGEEFFFESDTA